MNIIFIVGTAGSGKSELTGSFTSWLEHQGEDVISVNLDPGAITLPYSPSVNVRDYVKVEEVMEEYSLGPNGGLMVACDMIIDVIDELYREIQEFVPEVVIIDTPGQMELFAFRSSGPYITASLSRERTAVLFLVDSVFAERPSGLTSSLLLATSVGYRLQKPQLNLLSKADLLPKESIERALRWVENPLDLMEALSKELAGLGREVNQRICEAIHDVNPSPHLLPVSAKTGEGLDDLFSQLQWVFGGGGEEYVS